MHFRPWPAWGKPKAFGGEPKIQLSQVFQHCLPLHNTRLCFLSLSLLVSPLFLHVLAGCHEFWACQLSFRVFCLPKCKAIFHAWRSVMAAVWPRVAPCLLFWLSLFLCSLFLLCATNSGHASLFSRFSVSISVNFLCERFFSLRSFCPMASVSLHAMAFFALSVQVHILCKLFVAMVATQRPFPVHALPLCEIFFLCVCVLSWLPFAPECFSVILSVSRSIHTL